MTELSNEELKDVNAMLKELESLRKKNETLVKALEKIAIDSDENTGFSRSEDECVFYIDVAKKALAETVTTQKSDSGGGTTSSIDSDEDFAPIGKTKRLISIDEHDQLLEQATALASALEAIASHKDQTNLGECCVNKTCQPVYDDGEKVAHCSFQYGVNRGFNTCAYPASEALSNWTAFREGVGSA